MMDGLKRADDGSARPLDEEWREIQKLDEEAGRWWDRYCEQKQRIAALETENAQLKRELERSEEARYAMADAADAREAELERLQECEKARAVGLKILAPLRAKPAEGDDRQRMLNAGIGLLEIE